MRELDDEVVHLRERLEIAKAGLQEEKMASELLRTRLEASDREVAQTREKARRAEEEAKEHSAATTTRAVGLADELVVLKSLVDVRAEEVERARSETKAAATGLRAAEEEGRRQAREAARAREQLRAERDGLGRVSLELEVRGVRMCVCMLWRWAPCGGCGLRFWRDDQGSMLRFDFVHECVSVPSCLPRNFTT